MAGCAGSEIKSQAEPEPVTVTIVETETVAAEPAAPPETAPPETEAPPETQALAEAEPVEEEAETAGATESEGSAAGVGDSITLAGTGAELTMRVTLVAIVDPVPSGDFFEPQKGNRFVAVRLRLENVGTLIYNDSPSNGAILIDTDGQGFTATFGPATPDLGSPKIAPGDRRVGFVSFEVPKGAKLRTFQFTLDSGFGPETGDWKLGSA